MSRSQLSGLEAVVCLLASVALGAGSEVNSIGMRLVRIEPGEFIMGVDKTPLPEEVAGKRWRANGDPDEKPVHKVRINRPFHMAATEVTNVQYEQFDPEHRKVRGKYGFSKGDHEAVVFVSWHDAVAFCQWLSKKEGKPYRLPTEAEWEYACRAGTSTHYHTGDALPREFRKNQGEVWFPQRKSDFVTLTVGLTPANAWGLHDMHGNVEEWCCDWYGPYTSPAQVDPLGYADGDFKVTRGGSHSTLVYYLRSANRSGTLPEDSSWLIGFRVVMGELLETKPLPAPEPPLHQQHVKQTTPKDLPKGPDPSKPYFAGPKKYVKIAPGSYGPMFSSHNHDPAIVECPNGDLLAVWYSCVQEPGRELCLVASRLRRGAEEWEPAAPFWDAPDRNDHAPALWLDEQGTIYFFCGLSAATGFQPSLALVMRTSKDSGATWSRGKIVCPERGVHNQPVESVFRTKEGCIVLPCDSRLHKGGPGTMLFLSRDGQTWRDAGGRIAGIHAGVVQLADGSLLAYGRGSDIDGRSPQSMSTDLGKTWTYSASPFPRIGGNQRLVLMRLKEGPLLCVSFTDTINAPRDKGMAIKDTTGKERKVYGLFAAVSYDEGKTWPCRRLVSDDGPGMRVERMDGRRFTMSATTAEPRGYMSACQTPDGIIHLISSRQHYAFNLKWLTMLPPAAPPEPPPPTQQRLPVKVALPKVYDASGLPSKVGTRWRFTGSGWEEADAVSFPRPGVALIDTGKGQRARWMDDFADGFGKVDARKGFTVEIRMQVLKSTVDARGIDFEAYLGDGYSSGDHYFVGVTTGRVLWNDGGFKVLADKLDNHSAMHTYRIAVRPDGVAQVYRDGEFLAVRPPRAGIDGMNRPRGPYLQWGEGAGGSEGDFLVSHVAHDLAGPFQPE